MRNARRHKEQCGNECSVCVMCLCLCVRDWTHGVLIWYGLHVNNTDTKYWVDRLGSYLMWTQFNCIYMVNYFNSEVYEVKINILKNTSKTKRSSGTSQYHQRIIMAFQGKLSTSTAKRKSGKEISIITYGGIHFCTCACIGCHVKLDNLMRKRHTVDTLFACAWP